MACIQRAVNTAGTIILVAKTAYLRKVDQTPSLFRYTGDCPLRSDVSEIQRHTTGNLPQVILRCRKPLYLHIAAITRS